MGAPWSRLAWWGGLIWALALGMAACQAQVAPGSPSLPSPTVARTPSLVAPSPTPPYVPCQVVAAPTPAEKGPLLPTDHFRGDANAAVWVVVYGDFQSPAYAAMAQRLERLRQERPREIAWVFRAYPLVPVHDKALLAVQIAEAAGWQGAFWPMHDVLVQQWDAWHALPVDAFWDWVLSQARALGLDAERLRRDATSPEAERLAREAWERGRAAGLVSVPILFINGELYTGPHDEASLRAVLALEALSARMVTACPPRRPPEQLPTAAVFATDRGRFRVALLPEQNPDGVNSFVFLAERGWYDDTPVYRVIPGQAVYLGDPSGTGMGHAGFLFAAAPTSPDPEGPGWVVLDWVSPGMVDGRLAIRLGTTSPPALRGAPVIGRVVEGLDILQRLPEWRPEDPNGPPPLYVYRIELDTR
ncbi:MAG: thioredoxin domain-containing protein [Chloroflexi bacterium]|nr:thioredoxin domain-containing protein [Chloroflexota bacterium]